MTHSGCSGPLGAVSGAKKKVTFEGGYETPDGGSFELEFPRPPSLMQNRCGSFCRRNCVEPRPTNLSAGFELTFEGGLEMQGDDAEKLTTQLAKFASGAAYVSANCGGKNLMNRLERISEVNTPRSAPLYELRALRYGPTDTGFEVWQLPAPATPQIRAARTDRGASRARNLQLVEHRVLKQLFQAGITLGTVDSVSGRLDYKLTEDLALTLGLLFRVLAPMRNRENMRSVAEGIEAMEGEEDGLLAGDGDASQESEDAF